MAPRRSTQEAHTEELAEMREALALPEEPTPQKTQRRRTQDEMEHSLALILSGRPRPRDDESEQILHDAINEVIALRQMNMDLMQSISTAYQNGVAAIRDLTSR